VVNAHTLSNSRPLINLNPAKWITQGTVKIVAPGGTYRGRAYPSVIGGVANVFNYQGGLILGSEDCPWSPAIVGRYFAVTEPSEVLLPDDPSSAGGYAQLAGRTVYRWYPIREFHQNPDGTKVLKIERVRWSAVAAGAPKLFDDDNYTTDGHERPLHYAIAPGAWVYDISQGWSDCLATGGWIGADAPRKLKLVPNGDRGTEFDFAPGDPIEQAIGADPWQPRPLRIRQFDQLPSTMDNASIEVEQLGRVQVPIGLALHGIITSRDDLATRKDRKPPYHTAIQINSLANVGINFEAEVTEAALMFRQPRDRPQPIRWRTSTPAGGSSLQVDPQTGTLVYTGGDVAVSGGALQGVAGLSATTTPARNLRGINVAVKPGARELHILFARPEADAQYAVSITPSWMTPFCVPEKTARGFTVRFGTAAPKQARLDWMVVR